MTFTQFLEKWGKTMFEAPLGSAAPGPAGSAWPFQARFAGRLDIVTTELAGDHPEWAGLRAMLIRPDGYIAWATDGDDAPPLDTWLGRALFRDWPPATDSRAWTGCGPSSRARHAFSRKGLPGASGA